MKGLTHHNSRLSVVEPLNELHGGTLATATGTHQGYCLTLIHRDVQLLKDLGIRASRVVELHIFENDLGLEPFLYNKNFLDVIAEYHNFYYQLFPSASIQSSNWQKISKLIVCLFLWDFLKKISHFVLFCAIKKRSF